MVDIKLRKVIRTTSGAVLSTNKQWLLYLASIESPHIRRQNSVVKEKVNIYNHQEFPIKEDGIAYPRLEC